MTGRKGRVSFRRALLFMAGLFSVLLAMSPAVESARADTPAPPPPGVGSASPLESGTYRANEPGMAIQLERDTQATFSPNYVALLVKVSENGGPPKRSFEVFAAATSAQGEQTETYGCLAGSSAGLFSCTVIVEVGGDWTFTGFVNKVREDPDDPPENLGEAALALQIEAPRLTGEGIVEQGVAASPWEVAVLWIHSVVATGWFVCGGLLILLSTAFGRRVLSGRATHLLELELDHIIMGLRFLTVAVSGTGVYMLFRFVAYDFPTSSDRLDAVFELPYGKPYYLALLLKIGLYILLVPMSLLLAREARRRSTKLLRVGSTPSGTESGQPKVVSAREIWGAWAEQKEGVAPAAAGPTTLLQEHRLDAPPEQPPPAAQPLTQTSATAADEPTSARIKVVTLAVVAGGAGIWTCVVIFKYVHQLIEAASALAAG